MVYRAILISLLVFSCTISLAQNALKLQNELKLDTLRLWVNYPSEFTVDNYAQFDSILNASITRFNEHGTYFVVLDSNNKTNRILIDMRRIRYVNLTKNLVCTALSLALVGGHIYMVSVQGWTLLLWPILLPSTVSTLKIHYDPNMVTSNPTIKSHVSSFGYWISKERQSHKFQKKFDKEMFKLLIRIDKQNIKNILRQAKIRSRQ